MEKIFIPLTLFCLIHVCALSQKKDSLQMETTAAAAGGGGGCTAPGNPPNPTASTNLCGPKTLSRTTSPPVGTVWYWQTVSYGTSVDNSSSTYTANQSGTYYLRAYKPSCDMWSSGAGYKTVTINDPAAPSTPSYQDYCSSGVLTAGTPPSGITWYWQGLSSSGTSTANSSSTYTAYSSGTYYIRSYHNATGCWGPSTGRAITLTQAPPTPPTPLSSGGCGQVNLSWDGTPNQFIRWCWQTSSTGTTMSNMTSSYTVYSSGTYYLRAYDLNTGCWSSASQKSVTVNPIPDVAATSDQTICSGQQTAISMTNPNGIPGTTFKWTVSMSNVTGAVAGTGNTISQTLYASTSSSGSATYTIIPTANGCDGSPIYRTVTVKPVPIAAASNQELCSGQSTFITLSNPNGISGTTYNWTVSQSNVSGAQGGSGATITQPLTTNSSSGGTATYTIIPSANGCVGNPISAVATVKPVPNAAALGQELCSGQSTSITITNPNGVTATTYNWTVSQSNVSGAQAGSGSTIAQPLTTDSSSGGTATYTITPSANGCVGNPISTVATVKPVPIAAAANQEICSGQSTSINISNPNGITGTTYNWTVSHLNASGASNGSGSFIAQPLTATASVNGTVTYTVTPSANGCVGPAISPIVTVKPLPTVAAPANHYLFTQNSTIISITNPNSVSGTTFDWTASPSNVSGASSGTGSVIQQLLTSANGGTVTYTITPKANNCVGSSITSLATVYAKPNVLSTSDRIVFGPATLSTSTGYDSYTWKNASAQVVGTSATLTTSTPDTYTLTVTKMNASGSSLPFTLKDQFAGQNVNYIVSNSFLVEGITPGMSPGSRSVNEISQTIQYFDGLGRPIQTVVTQGSPAQHDVVQPFIYDHYGRETHKYLPFVANETSGLYKENVINPNTGNYQGAASGFYSGGAAGIAVDIPYGITMFENSPLNRVTKQGAHGAVWQPDANNDYLTSSDHTIKFSYETNDAAEVLRWNYIFPSQDFPLGLVSATTNGVPNKYPANQLVRNRTKDENQIEVITYTDKNGRVILKRNQAPANTWADTYYIYNDFGSLVAVIPPEAVSKINASSANYHTAADDNSRNTFLKQWAFRYRYDSRVRMTMKQVPGAEPVYMVYDDRDRLVLTQDGNQRKASPNEWTFTKYDAMNRPVLTGIYKDVMNYDQSAMQGVVNAFYVSAPSAQWYEEFKSTGAIVHGYTNQSFPDVSAEADYLTITYYDTHDFVNAYAGSSLNYNGKDLSGQPTTSFERVLGHVTGTKVKTLGTNQHLWTVNYYDDRYRLIQAVKQNHKNGVDRISTLFDFSGKVLATKITHTSGPNTTLVTKERNEYDHAGRLKAIFHSVGQPVKWINAVNVTVEGSTVRKTGGALQGWDAGAFSENSIPAGQDGWVEYMVDNTNTYRMLGFSDNDDNASYTSIDYALYVHTDGKLYVYESGVYRGLYGTYTTSDIFRVERKYGIIYYKKNGITFYTSQIPSTSKLHVDAALYSQGTSLITATMGIGSADIEIVKNSYNELGQLVDKTLTGSVDNYDQSVDYRYNIRGWLTSINNAQLDQESLTNDDMNDLFGMELLYNSQDAALGNTDLYNGNISAVKWKTPIHGVTALEDRKSYVYSYDPLNRLTQASFAAYHTQAGWSAEANTFDESLTYDLNGNIKALQRTEAKAGVSSFSIVPQQIDSLDYTYLDGNKLSQVKDVSLHKGGFKDGATHANEFLYDDNGNLIKDLNKGIDSISYNHLNLPDLITFSNGNTIQYTYDATGAKLKQTVTDTTAIKVTDYIGNMVYERDTLQFFSIPEGRVVNNDGDYEYQFILKDHLGNTRVLYGNPYEAGNLLPNADCNTLDYFLSVHNATRTLEIINGESYLAFVSTQNTNTPGMMTGAPINVRPGEKYSFKVKGYRSTPNPAYLYVVTNMGDLVWPGSNLPCGLANEAWVSSDFTIPAGVTTIRLAVFWSATYGLTSGDTFYLNEIALLKHNDEDYNAGFEVSSQGDESLLFSNYHPGKINNSGVYSHTGNSAYLLSASTQVSNQIIGPAKSIRVYPGDAVHMEVYGRYLTTTGGGTDVGTIIAGALQTAFNLSAGGGTDVAFQSISNLFGDGAIIGTLAHPYENEVPPKAFLNYILFDDNYVPYDFGYDQIGNEGAMPGSTSDKMNLVAKVSKPGYIYIYLSNENEVVQEVYFDDLAIKHVKGVAIQQNDYYPFGLTFNSYQRENAVDQNYQFNGKERQDELDLGWDDFGARMYMSDIGRWGVVDPLAPKYSHLSPYNFVENNPINIVDPDGRSGEPVIDKKNKTITVHSNIVMYGGAASADLAKSTAKDIQDKWNAAGGKVTVGGVEYSVQFSVTGSYNDKLTADDVSKNTDIKNNFIRVEESVEGGVSYMDDLGSNTGEFLLKNIKADGSTTEAHEFGHGYGLDHPADSDLRGEGQPGIMNPRGTIVDPQYQYDPAAAPGAKGGTINPETRKVTQQDVNNLGLDKVKYDASGRGRLGKLTNKYHEKKP